VIFALNAALALLLITSNPSEPSWRFAAQTLSSG
jgi:hypothetical protein